MVVEVRCENLEIEFPYFDHLTRSLRARLTGKYQIERSHKALNGITVEILQGERVGLLGQNGAGKSTFLRALAGVYAPTKGSVTTVSAISSMFEIAAGMDYDASGYDNIPLLMVTRGIPLSSLDAVTKDVEEFSELGDALVRPVRTYSAGMRLRIAFAVATFQTGGLLLLDEAIGVGDQSFRQKSNARILNSIENAGTLVLASHANPVLDQYCDRGLVFDQGKISFDGPIKDAIAHYETAKVEKINKAKA